MMMRAINTRDDTRATSVLGDGSVKMYDIGVRDKQRLAYHRKPERATFSHISQETRKSCHLAYHDINPLLQLCQFVIMYPCRVFHILHPLIARIVELIERKLSRNSLN